METRARVLLLSLAAAVLPGCASLHWPWADRDASVAEEPATTAAEEPSDTPPRVIEPEVERREVLSEFDAQVRKAVSHVSNINALLDLFYFALRPAGRAVQPPQDQARSAALIISGPRLCRSRRRPSSSPRRSSPAESGRDSRRSRRPR